MKGKALFSILAIGIVLVAAAGIAHAEHPRTWISPEQPHAGDDVRIYYSDPNATNVFITVYDENGRAYLRSDYGHEGDVWWIQVSDLSGGDYYYKIDASGPDRYGNHTEVRFHVEEGSAILESGDSGMTTVLTIVAIFGAIIAIIIILRRADK